MSNTGLHTAIKLDDLNCSFPPVTLFKVVTHKPKGWLFDGTAGLIERCTAMFPDETPITADDVYGPTGQPCITRASLHSWLMNCSAAGPTGGNTSKEEWDRFVSQKQAAYEFLYQGTQVTK